MHNEWIFGFATSIEDRISIFRGIQRDNNTDIHLEKWRARKTLLTESDFCCMLQHQGWSEHDFSMGVSPLTEEDLKILFQQVVQGQDWYKLHKNLFSSSPAFKGFKLREALRFHVHHYINHVRDFAKKFKNIVISDACLNTMRESLESDLLNIANRTLVWDVHDISEKEQIRDIDNEKAFNEYMSYRFGTAISTQQFFLEYPTLARLLAERLIYAEINTEKMLSALDESQNELIDKFGLQLPLFLNECVWQQGDSHSGGKTTTKLNINQTVLYFKYHNNDALIRFNEFLSSIETIDDRHTFCKVSCISGADYCIEKQIKNTSCNDAAQIERYYKRFGALVAIAYFLGATDLHMENLVAMGEYPVLIDVETLIRPQERRVYSNIEPKSFFFEKGSAVTTGLLPMQKYWNRQLDLSALNGVEQKLPYKVRKLKNENTSDVFYQLEEHTLKISDNVPKLNGVSTLFTNYASSIIVGYNEMISLITSNKAIMTGMVSSLFSGINQRVLLRDTEDYHNFLSFASHPTCMVDYIEREKIFENMWNNSFVNKDVIGHEVCSLLVNDIPFFMAETSSLDLYSPAGIITDFFTIDILNNFTQHSARLNSISLQYSELLLKESLGILTTNYQAIDINHRNAENVVENVHDMVEDIARIIAQHVHIDQDRKNVFWAQVLKMEGNIYMLNYPDANLYDGNAGLFIFYYIYHNVLQSDKYNNLLQALKYEVFQTAAQDGRISAFYGVGSRIAAAFVAYHFSKEKEYLSYIQEGLDEILKCDISKVSWDWIHGKAGLTNLVATIYEQCRIGAARDVLIMLTSNLEMDNIDMPGFAHGQSGILHALIYANRQLNDERIATKIEEIYRSVSKTKEDIELNSSWCRGSLGINRAMSNYKKNSLLFVPATERAHPNACICHGFYGQISDYIDQLKHGDLPLYLFHEIIQDILNRPIILECNSVLKPLGLFTGLSGIGYQLLRILAPDRTPDILFFSA